MKSHCIALFLLLIITNQSCKKQDTSTPVTPPDPTDTTIIKTDPIDVGSNVYIAGVELTDSFFTLKYWNNGKAFTIDSVRPFSTATERAWPSSIFVSGSDIYITALSAKNDGTNSAVGKYWKNGVATIVTDTLQRGTLNSVFVSNNDVYMAGNETSQVNNLVAYWKNGVAVPLINGPIPGSANSVFVSGNDVYVAGNERIRQLQDNTSAVYWKNGNRIILSNDSIESAEATSVFVSGSDVFVSGDVYTGTHIEAVYWKNGVRTILSFNDSLDEHTTAIGVSGNDVYIAGHAGYVAKYWKNDSPVNLTDGLHEAAATSLSIANGDVYIAGYDYDIPKYWKNGVAHVIKNEPWYLHGMAYAIYVTK